MKTFVCITLVCCCCVALQAAQVTLKNGDRLTGAIVSLTDKKLTVHTDYAGDVTIDWAAVTQFTSDQPMVVTKTDKQVVSGTVNAQDSSIAVATASGTQTIPQSDVAVIRSQADQAAYEHSLHPGFLEDWMGGGSFGFALARGNSDTTNLALGFTADRKTTTDEWNVVAASLYSTSTASNVTATTANTFGGALTYSHNLTPRLYGFGMFTGLYDDLQGLNERLSPDGGLGYHVIASKTTTLDLQGGFGYTYENYVGGVTNNYVNANIGEILTYAFNANTTITQNLYFYPYLNDSGNYRGVGTFTVASKFYKALTWNLAFGDIYNSKPLTGKKDNDLVLTTGLGITFGAKPK